jgi:hypothetical protein
VAWSSYLHPHPNHLHGRKPQANVLPTQKNKLRPSFNPKTLPTGAIDLLNNMGDSWHSPTRILCLDDGGIRGLSALMILRKIMNEIADSEDAEFGSLLPCDYFDFIRGTSTGGLIAILLGRLQNTVREGIDVYSTLAGADWSTKALTKDAKLKTVVELNSRSCHAHVYTHVTDGMSRFVKSFKYICALAVETILTTYV